MSGGLPFLARHSIVRAAPNMPLHPQAQAFLNQPSDLNASAWSEMTPAHARETYNGLTHLTGHGPALHQVEDLMLPGIVLLRVYRPSAQRPLPAVIYFHGGGWVLGNVETHDTLCRRLAHGSGCALVSVDYRLAPEHPFPAPLEDCVQAVRYIAAHASELGFDPARLAVGGDSAGGNLAAAVTLRLRDEGGPSLHSQWLIYPVTEARFDTVSYEAFATGHGLTRAEMQFFWSQYAPRLDDRRHPLASPLLASSLAGLPPAHVITAEYDVLRDEGEAYAARLNAAGIPATLHRYEGMLHGFMHFAEPFDDGKRAVAEMAESLRNSLRP